MQTEIWLLVNITREWDDPGGLAALNHALSQVRLRCFLGTLIACIVSAIIIAASAAAGATALAESIETAHALDALLTNTAQEMMQQTRIDQEILVRLSAIESAVIWLGEWQDACVTCQQLTWDPSFSKLYVIPLKWNSSQHSWEEVQHHLREAFPPISKEKLIDSNLSYVNNFRTLSDSPSKRSFRPCITIYKGSIQKLGLKD